ncbi:MAG: sortase [Pseudomonadota bacterium]
MGKLRLGLALAFIAAGVGLIGYGLMTPAKAWLAARLLDHAWERLLAGDEDVRPWPWMDSEPVARLHVQKADAETAGEQPSFVVMRGVSGSVLAFAPGWHERTMLPGAEGTTLISAHRETHFAILKDIGRNDRLMIEDRTGSKVVYRVSEMIVTEAPVLSLRQIEDDQRLILVTCYPLDAWRPNSPERLVVVAEPI